MTTDCLNKQQLYIFTDVTGTARHDLTPEVSQGGRKQRLFEEEGGLSECFQFTENMVLRVSN